MTWGNPQAFWFVLLLIPFVGTSLYWLRNRAHLLTLIGSQSSIRNWNHAAVLLVLGVTCIVIALAQPRDGYEELQLVRENRDIVIVLDVSQSMLAEDVLPNRMERARWEIRSLLKQLKGERVALVLFAKRAYVRMPLSKEYDVLEKLLAESHPKKIKAQGSDLSTALRVAADLFPKEEGARSIVLVSDGEDHEKGLESVVSLLSKREISVYSLGIGTTEGGVIPRMQGGYILDDMGELVKSTRLDEPLAYIATQTRGAFSVSQPGLGDWKVLYSQGIARQSSTGTRMEEEKIWNELFFWPLGLGFLLCVSSYGVRSMLLFLLLIRPVSAQEVDVRDIASIEEYALSLYDQGQYRQAQNLLEEVVRNGDSRSMRDRARYNSALAAYQQGQLDKALEALDSMEKPNPQSIHNAQYIKKEIDQRRKNEAQSPPQQEEQDQQGDGESQDGEQGDAPQEPSENESQQDEPSQQDSSQSNDSQSEGPPQGPPPSEPNGDESEQDLSDNEGIPQEALSPEEWSKREAERLLDSVQEGEHRGFGQDGQGSSGTKTW